MEQRLYGVAAGNAVKLYGYIWRLLLGRRDARQYTYIYTVTLYPVIIQYLCGSPLL